MTEEIAEKKPHHLKGRPSPLRGIKVAIKYKDGDNSWTGRGKMPLWLKAKINAGHSLSEFKHDGQKAPDAVPADEEKQ